MNVYAFDFDGTLTKRDTLIEMIRFAKGNTKTLWGFACFSPMLILMKAGLYPNWKAKQKLFSHFFKGMEETAFNTLCNDFARQKAKALLRPAGMDRVRKALAEGSNVIIISASIDNWVRPFFDEFGNSVHIEGTKIEVKDGKLTGFFASNNCYGTEKVRRLRLVYPDRAAYRLIAYGDSKGDYELLEYADEGYFKPFRR